MLLAEAGLGVWPSRGARRRLSQQTAAGQLSRLSSRALSELPKQPAEAALQSRSLKLSHYDKDDAARVARPGLRSGAWSSPSGQPSRWLSQLAAETVPSAANLQTSDSSCMPWGSHISGIRKFCPTASCSYTRHKPTPHDKVTAKRAWICTMCVCVTDFHLAMSQPLQGAREPELDLGNSKKNMREGARLLVPCREGIQTRSTTTWPWQPGWHHSRGWRRPH